MLCFSVLKAKQRQIRSDFPEAVGLRIHRAISWLGRAEQEGQGFRLPTNPELAAILGTVPEPVSRKLGQFFREGLIQMKDRRVWITDTAVLRQVAEE